MRELLFHDIQLCGSGGKSLKAKQILTWARESPVDVTSLFVLTGGLYICVFDLKGDAASGGV